MRRSRHPGRAARAAAGVALVRAGALLVDVRTPQEFEGGHVAEAVNVPLSALGAPGAPGLPDRHDRPVVAMCGVGKRSLTAMLLLKAQRYERVKSLRGGITAWKEAGYPLKVT